MKINTAQFCAVLLFKDNNIVINNLNQFLKAHKRHLRPLLIAAALGIVYAAVLEFTDFYIPCAFRVLTGLHCPGCGVSRFCMCLLHLDFVGAARANYALALLCPLWAAALIVRALWNPAWFRPRGKVEKVLLWGSVGVLSAFGVVRNIAGI